MEGLLRAFLGTGNRRCSEVDRRGRCGIQRLWEKTQLRDVQISQPLSKSRRGLPTSIGQLPELAHGVDLPAGALGKCWVVGRRRIHLMFEYLEAFSPLQSIPRAIGRHDS